MSLVSRMKCKLSGSVSVKTSGRYHDMQIVAERGFVSALPLLTSVFPPLKETWHLAQERN